MTAPTTITEIEKVQKIFKDAKNQAERTKKYTPDFPLNRSAPNWVFVYGTLKKGFVNNDLLTSATHIGSATTRTSDYIMYQEGAAHYPYVQRVTEIDEKFFREAQGRLFGDLYQVTGEQLATLDLLEGNGSHYRRVKVPIVWNYMDINAPMNPATPVKPDDVGGKFITAYIYVRMGQLPTEHSFKGANPLNKFNRKIPTKFDYNTYMFDYASQFSSNR